MKQAVKKISRPGIWPAVPSNWRLLIAGMVHQSGNRIRLSTASYTVIGCGPSSILRSKPMFAPRLPDYMPTDTHHPTNFAPGPGERFGRPGCHHSHHSHLGASSVTLREAFSIPRQHFRHEGERFSFSPLRKIHFGSKTKHRQVLSLFSNQVHMELRCEAQSWRITWTGQDLARSGIVV
ncbi:hypothetical protein TEQG_04965 [Trichophyton equinum CBS 127.97]|uniref:Uncharacterized protein n=1 Tax=Trichophyton equinum (strain ATCC MYA-4606 / CBS 127.97) TaxID=559882 RepID=F2PVP0_TRIEC|nr:hypothetical protein TEQG_04965 [Trichophyton equinum CBS 127.97]